MTGECRNDPFRRSLHWLKTWMSFPLSRLVRNWKLQLYGRRLLNNPRECDFPGSTWEWITECPHNLYMYICLCYLPRQIEKQWKTGFFSFACWINGRQLFRCWVDLQVGFAAGLLFHSGTFFQENKQKNINHVTSTTFKHIVWVWPFPGKKPVAHPNIITDHPTRHEKTERAPAGYMTIGWKTCSLRFEQRRCRCWGIWFANPVWEMIHVREEHHIN